jgi:hypothetical protein
MPGHGVSPDFIVLSSNSPTATTRQYGVTPVVTGALNPQTALLFIAVFDSWRLAWAPRSPRLEGINNPKYHPPRIFAAVFAAIPGIWAVVISACPSHPALIGGLGAVAVAPVGNGSIEQGLAGFRFSF